MVSVELISNYYLDTDGAINYLSGDPLGAVPSPRTLYAFFFSFFLFFFLFFASIPLSARLESPTRVSYSSRLIRIALLDAKVKCRFSGEG